MSVQTLEARVAAAIDTICKKPMGAEDIHFFELVDFRRPSFPRLPTRAQLLAYAGSPTWSDADRSVWKAFIERGQLQPAGFASEAGIIAIGLTNDAELYDSEIVAVGRDLCRLRGVIAN